MAVLTLAEFQKRTRSELVQGVVEDIFTLNPIYAVMPWDGYSGQGVTVNRETTIGDAQIVALDGTITAKATSVVTAATFTSTTLIGDAEIDGLQSAHSASDENDLEAMEISSKSKALGRLIQACIAGMSADGNAALFNSMPALVDSSQYVTTKSGGDVLSFLLLDQLLAKVDAKDGEVDFIQMSQRDFNAYKVLLRALGGTPGEWVVTLPDGRKTLSYEGIPIFVNRWLSTTETDDGAALTTGVQSSIYAGCWDDGSRKIGCSMIHPEAVDAGIVIDAIGAKEAKDQTIYRVKSYCNFAIFNRRGIARLTGIKAA